MIYSEEGQPHTLDPNNPPTYGYAYTTPEYDTNPKVLEHRVVIEDLKPNTKYYFRTVSRASPPVFSEEFTFETPAPEIPKEEVKETVERATLILASLQKKAQEEAKAEEEIQETPPEELSQEVTEEEMIEETPSVEETPEISVKEEEVSTPIFEEQTSQKGFLAAIGEFFRPSFVALIVIILALLAGVGFRFYKRKKK